MPMKARYTVLDGEVLAEKRGGVRHELVPDSLGSTVALLDSGQAISDTFAYWPYGEERTRTGTTATPFRFVGTQGYYRDSPSRSYVRARFLDQARARWMTPDPRAAGHEHGSPYVYAAARPTTDLDPSGLLPASTTKGGFGCPDRANAYCGAAKATKATGLDCICGVARIVCAIIGNPRYPPGIRNWFECMNKCMFDHWRTGDTREWSAAAETCRRCGPDSFPCCHDQIVADQAAFTDCARRCGAVPAPELLRYYSAMKGCCDPPSLFPSGP
jgi:RHS repeat-associated protein